MTNFDKRLQSLEARVKVLPTEQVGMEFDDEWLAAYLEELDHFMDISALIEFMESDDPESRLLRQLPESQELNNWVWDRFAR